MQLSDEQKRTIIEKAQELYRMMYSARCLEDSSVLEVNINNFKEACYDMSMLVHYLAKRAYNIPDEENLVFECEFRYDNYSGSHFFNNICGKTIDSTITQFDLSPYDNHDDCYTKLERVEYCEVPIKTMIELYEGQCYIKEFLKNKHSVKLGQSKNSNRFVGLLKHLRR